MNSSLSKLFLERSSFIVIGLTGRTGSGCTTAARILESEEIELPGVEDLQYKGEKFYSGLDINRYEIVKKYTEENWHKFYHISISDLISAYFLNLNSQDAVDFVYANRTGDLDIKRVENLLNNGAFQTTVINKKYKELLEKILDHQEKPIFTKEENEEFIRFLTLFRRFNKKLKSELNDLQNGLYVSVFQEAGNSIRKIGWIDKDYINMDFDPEAVFSLPETVNRIIKTIRRISKDEKTFIVIDAIRNPFEARFFKDRYAAFYLVSINAPEEDRAKYLQSYRKFTKQQLDELDLKESGKKPVSSDEKEEGSNKIKPAWEENFINQNVKKCVEISDIHIFNPRNELHNNNILKAQLAWYFALMLHPGLTTPRSVERVMQLAYTAKTNSGCISRQVGAAITDEDFSVKAIGWNDVAKGQVPCGLRSLGGLKRSFDDVTYSHFERHDEAFRDEANKKHVKLIALRDELKGRNLSYCFKDIKNNLDKKGNQVHTRSLHAEENAFLQLSKYGGSGIVGGKLFTTASPCELCAKKAYQLGIKEIYFIDPYPGIARDHILNIGSNPPELVQFMGAIGKGYHQLYEPTLPYKDELSFYE